MQIASTEMVFYGGSSKLTRLPTANNTARPSVNRVMVEELRESNISYSGLNRSMICARFRKYRNRSGLKKTVKPEVAQV